MSTQRPTAELTRSSMLAKQIKKDWWWTSLFLILFSLAFSFLKTETELQRFDLLFYDYASAIAKTQPPTQTPSLRPALIIIDDESINKMGHWPWRRNTYARILDHLQLAKAVGIDVIFQDLNPLYPHDDAFLSYSIKQHGRVVLAGTMDANQTALHPPIPSLAESAAALGYINIYPNRDGVVRTTQLFTDINDQPIHHFALALLAAAKDSDLISKTTSDPMGPNRLIPFAGPTGSFDTYSFYDVYSGAISPEVFKDRYVIIGAWSSGLGDYYPTPLSSSGHTSMSGVEVLANILESTLQQRWIQTLSPTTNALLSILPVLLICYILRSLPPRAAILVTLLIVVGVLLGSSLLLRIFAIWAPPSAALLGTLLAYPVWYWRSQETVIQYVNKELAEMRRHDPSLNQALQNSPDTHSLPERLGHLHQAIDLLREAQQRREETLRFISHDMRAPQNSILSLISMQRNHELDLSVDDMLKRVESYSQSTLGLVDDFIDLARVEAMELHFETLCVNDVLAEVCDDAWIRAKAKNIQVEFHEPDHTLWAAVDPKLFKRALSNLIDNGIKYSSTNTTICCDMHQQDSNLIIRISDQGWGIPPTDLPTIFQAFKRAHASRSDGPTGSGLGLAFVQTVIHRHFGDICVSSTEGVGTTFTIYLPAENALLQ